MKIKFLSFLLIVLFSCSPKQAAPVSEIEVNEIKDDHVRYSLTLLAAGDNLFHETVINTHKQGDTYDFSPIYTEVKELVKNADLAFINQETVMAGNGFDYQGYPTFNTPQSLAKTIADTGFDIVNLANNHAMDMNKDGIYATLDLFDTLENITVIGARKKGESHSIITMNNITVGFLSYTYGLNGFTLPYGEPNLISLINRDKMSQEINVLRPLCDFLVVSVHWGDEYFLQPNAFQKNLALFLAQHNVDLIIGHHPHVLQPFAVFDRPDGNKTLCFYSLGNFASHQREKERVLGAFMLVTFIIEESELLPRKLYISNSGLIPVVCHFETGYTNTKVYPLYSYTQELLEKHYLRRLDPAMNFEFIKNLLNGLETKIIMHNPF